MTQSDIALRLAICDKWTNATWELRQLLMSEQITLKEYIDKRDALDTFYKSKLN